MAVSVVEDDQFHSLWCPLYWSARVSGKEAKWCAQLRLWMYHYRYSEPLSLKTVTEDNHSVLLLGHPRGMEKSGCRGILPKLFEATFKPSKEMMWSGKCPRSLQGFLLTVLCFNFGSLQNSNFSEVFICFFKGQSINWWVGDKYTCKSGGARRGPCSCSQGPGGHTAPDWVMWSLLNIQLVNASL